MLNFLPHWKLVSNYVIPREIDHETECAFLFKMQQCNKVIQHKEENLPGIFAPKSANFALRFIHSYVHLIIIHIFSIQRRQIRGAQWAESVITGREYV